MYPLRLPIGLAFWLFSMLSPVLALSTRASPRDGGKSSSPFVAVSGTGFSVHGKNFTFVGANAYWLPYLDSDDDIRKTFANMSKSGISVVRTWAFNDVTTVPDTGSWLLLIKNGNTTINNGTNGIQRLDRVIKFAKQYNIYLYFSMTNNWLPSVNAPPPPKDSCPLPRNYLSNHYGGMDAYVQEFGVKKTHDEFYTNKKVRKAFNKYVRTIVRRYANEPTIIAWELANDARCTSTLPSSDHCNTNTITRWHAETAKFIRSIDRNHLITSGSHGFLCPSCPKLFPLPPPPKHSPTPGITRKRTADGFMPPSKFGKRYVEPRESSTHDGMTIRGLWNAPSGAKRQTSGGLSAYNGAFGVDSQDILNAPDIDFGTFQLFPDQVNYGAKATVTEAEPPSRNFNKTLNETVGWIHAQIYSARTVGKPVVLSAFGIVTHDNLPFFVPVNDTSPVVKSPPKHKDQKRQDPGTVGQGATQGQQDTAYSTWGGASSGGTAGMSQYQWPSQLDAVGDAAPNPTSGSPNISPNDGYRPDVNQAPRIVSETAPRGNPP